jgi:hypothetical protein
VPVEGLTPIAEEIIVLKEKKKEKIGSGPYKEISEDENDSDEVKEEEGATDKKDKHVHKKLVKTEKREKRVLKKQLKLAFGTASRQNVVKDMV